MGGSDSVGSALAVPEVVEGEGMVLEVMLLWVMLLCVG